MRRDKIVYSLCIGDIQDVAEEKLERKLDEQELKEVVDKVGDYIPWFDAIENTFDDLNLKLKDQ
ncbi:MAG: hypothetical protein ACYDA4_01640 [Ignavibacteriaceae bacterium]